MPNKKTSSSKKKKRVAKPKVKLSARKVYTLCAVIFAVCAVSLATSVYVASGDSTLPPVAQNVTSQTAPQTSVTQPVPQASSSKPAMPENAVTSSPQKQAVAQKNAQSAPAPSTATQSASAQAKQVSQASATAQAKPATQAAPVQTKPAAQAKTAAQASATTQTKPKTQVAATQTKQATPQKVDTTKQLASAKVDKTEKAPAGAASSGQTKPASKPAPAPQQKPVPTSAQAPAPKADPFNIPQAKNGATLVFVIDDAGLHVENVRKYTALPFPITIAVLPKLSQTRQCAEQIRKDGKELMLHQPMQAVNLNINPGEGKISPEMSTRQVAAQIKENIAELGGGVKGFNNHEGSLITADSIKMGAVLETADELGVYFLDSRTNAQSKARQAALERDMHIFERNAPFLDNAVNREEMLSEIMKSLAVANKAGHAIIIGHVDKSVNILPKLLSDMYPYLKEKGYRFATPSTL